MAALAAGTAATAAPGEVLIYCPGIQEKSRFLDSGWEIGIWYYSHLEIDIYLAVFIF